LCAVGQFVIKKTSFLSLNRTARTFVEFLFSSGMVVAAQSTFFKTDVAKSFKIRSKATVSFHKHNKSNLHDLIVLLVF